MKKSCFTNYLSAMITVCIATTTVSQTFSEGFNYQAVLRSSTGVILNQEPITIKIGIIATSISGTLIYEEEHPDTTTAYGLSQIVIGQGNSTGAGALVDFGNINWSAGDYFVNVKVDINNTGSFIDVSTSQFFAVPYAMHSRTSSQEYALSTLSDVDTANIEVGQTLVWDGNNWINSIIDSVNFAFTSDSSSFSDTAFYAINSGTSLMSDSANFAAYGDTSNHAATAGSAQFSDSATYSDTSLYSWNCINSWDLNGNSLTGTEFIGSVNAADVIFKTDSVERMRITSSGKIGINITSPTADFELIGDNGFLISGTHGSGASQVFTGDRLVYYPKKSHFYVGGGTINLNDSYIGDYSFASGFNNTPRGDYSTAFGYACSSNGEASFASGYASQANGNYSFAQGQNSIVNGVSAIGMGRAANSHGLASIALGYHPAATKAHAVSMGYYCSALDTSAYALGYRANVSHKGSFLYADASSTSATFYSTAENQFMVRAAGGTIFYSATDLSTGVTLPAGGGAWASVSDSTKKENILPVDEIDILNKLKSIEVSEWNYKTQDSSIRHIGPMAQDFYALFGYGESDTTITTIDIDGVNMAALKGLIHKAELLEEKTLAFKALNEKFHELKAEKETILHRLNEIEKHLEQRPLETAKK